MSGMTTRAFIVLILCLLPNLCFAELQQWRNKDGKTMSAELVDYDHATGKATFKKSNGTTYDYPVKNLDYSSRKRVLHQSKVSFSNPLEQFRGLPLVPTMIGFVVGILVVFLLMFAFWVIAAKMLTQGISIGEHSAIFVILWFITLVVYLPFNIIYYANFESFQPGATPPDWALLYSGAYFLVSVIVLFVFGGMIASHYAISYLRALGIQILFVLMPFLILFALIFIGYMVTIFI